MSFYISKVTVTGTGKKPSIVTFNKGLNIICGVSNSGKTCILKCIRFIMGAKDLPFDQQKTGYDSVSVDIMTPEGIIIIARSLAGKYANVISENKEIQSCEYDIDYKSKGNNRPVLNELWLKLIGVKQLPMIIKSQDFSRQRLSWRTILNLFWLKEEDIERPGSILLPKEYTQHTYFFASLLYLLTGDTYHELTEKDSDEISKAKKFAVRQFVNNRITELSNRRGLLVKELSNYSDIDIELEINNLVNKLSEIESSIAKATNESKELLSNLLNLKELEAEINITHSHFKSLKSQYTADIKRLSFIVDAELNLDKTENNSTCPFCESNICMSDHSSYIETSKAELNRIITQLQGLQESEADVLNNLLNTQNEIREIEEKKTLIEELIRSTLFPQAEKIKQNIKNYRLHIEMQQESLVLNNISEDLILELKRQEKEVVKEKIKFKPKEQFPVDFISSINDISEKIFKACNYNLKNIHFNKGTFDLEIDSYPKAVNHGKGYLALINTVLGLAFRQYLQESAYFKPGIFVIDTPLLGLDQGIDDKDPKSIRTSLFQYFINTQSLGQMIVIENNKDLPIIDYESNGVNVIEFTHDNYVSIYKKSRYGFLHDVYQEETI